MRRRRITNSDQNKNSREVEYEQAVSYIRHMYETRGQIFQFSVTLNAGVLAVVFQYLSANEAKLALSSVGFLVNLALTLMAWRSWHYLRVLEAYTINLEGKLKYGLISETARNMPKGIYSTTYLFFIYGTFILAWSGLVVYFLWQFI